MAHQIKVLVTKPANLNAIPKSHIVEKTNPLGIILAPQLLKTHYDINWEI